MNTLGGIANHAALAAVATWVFNDPEALIDIRTSRLGLLTFAAIIWIILEVLRRSRPNG